MHKNFSHIYIEAAAHEYPRTAEIKARFPAARCITIDSYKDMFNRPRQNWQAQKISQKLILAVKKEGLLYPGTDIAPDFGHPFFYYNTMLLNCVYDCSYCYLQGLYSSANLVAFVNEADFFQAAEEALQTHGSMYLCISYDTDLLGFETLFGLNARWIEFARTHPEILIESRTKSANIGSIAALHPASNFILAWTLSPDSIRETFEPRTPSLAKRLAAVRQALDLGWPVRICIDPMLLVPDWENVYSDLFLQIAAQLPVEKIQDFSIGTFRMNTAFLKNIRKQERPSSILYHPFSVTAGVASYESSQQDQLIAYAERGLESVGVASQQIRRAY